MKPRSQRTREPFKVSRILPVFYSACDVANGIGGDRLVYKLLILKHGSWVRIKELLSYWSYWPGDVNVEFRRRHARNLNSKQSCTIENR